METMEWTKIQNTIGLDNITLSRVSDYEIMLVGGNPGGSISKQLFDVEKNEWRDEAPLPTQFGGSKGGLVEHRAVEFPKKNGVCVICVGGFVDDDATEHPNHMIVFDVTQYTFRGRGHLVLFADLDHHFWTRCPL